MKNLGIRLTNEELLNVKGGALYSCTCDDSGLEYVVDKNSLTLAEATLATRCTNPNANDWCESDSGMG